MPIRQRADRFQVRVSLGGGRRVERTLPASAKRADAVSLEATLRRAVIDQVVVRPRRFTIADAFDRWETDARALRSGQKAKIAAKRLPFDLTVPQIVQLWIEARKAARMPGVRRHDLRHYFGSLLVQRGADAATVRDLMGHCSRSVRDFEVRPRRTGGGSANRGSGVGQEHRLEGRFLT
jgi:integrase